MLMPLENSVNMLTAQEFKIATVMTQIINPRMFIFLFYHKKFGASVRVRVVFRDGMSNKNNYVLPEFRVESIKENIPVLEAAKKIFESKAITYINKNYRRS